MVFTTRLWLFQIQVFLSPAGVMPGWCRVDFSLCLLHSRIQILHQTRTRARKCTLECKSSNWTLLDIYAPFNPFVNIRNVVKWRIVSIFHISLGPRRAKRNFLWRNMILDSYLNRLRSTHVERNALSVLIYTRLLCAQNRFRSTFVDPNASSICSNVLSLDARQSNCIVVY